MKRSKKFANPFYSLLLVAGITFVLTATAFVVMAFREAKASEAHFAQTADAAPAEIREHPLMDWMRRRGQTALLIELGFLAVFTFAAIGTDDYWQRRSTRANR